MDPPPGPDVPVSSRNLPPDIEEKPHCQIGNILGVNVAGGGHCDPAAAALGEVNVVEAGAGGDNEAEIRQHAHQIGGDGDAAGGEDGTSRLGMSEDELVEGERGFPGLE